MNHSILRVHPSDDLIVALRDLKAGETVQVDSTEYCLPEAVAAKHKFTIRSTIKGDFLKMYGQIVARATEAIPQGGLVTTRNVEHATDKVTAGVANTDWTGPDVSQWTDTCFNGFIREDGRVGTRNYWVVVPLVFCENRNIQVLSEAMISELGYSNPNRFQSWTRKLIELRNQGASETQIRATEFVDCEAAMGRPRQFANVDGIKFLRHEGGCGGTYEDAKNLCGLIAGYINHPNVAGATVLSLGCQKSERQTLEEEIQRRNPNIAKPVMVFDQQDIGSESTLLSDAIKHTFAGLMEANRCTREPSPLGKVVLGVECGGSDGFSGLSANPAIGHCSDFVVGLGGSVILSEFPELAGCENDLVRRCINEEVAERFLHIMREYDRRAVASGGGFDSNPSPGNIKDGLITDAIKSAGAARKGGTSPIMDVLDYPEQLRKAGLTLLCTPGGDVESTTAKAGSGATIQLFSTGLGTPTGNPVSPVIKISTNSDLAKRMPDLIDLDAGPIISGEESFEQTGHRILELVVATAGGDYMTRAERLGQDDFIPWKRGMSF